MAEALGPVDEVQLYQAPRLWGLPNPSPFCVKVETWLRLAGVPYRSRIGLPNRAPRGKVPWIEHRGEHVADSENIVRYLERVYKDPLREADLDDAQRATAQLVRRTVEEGTYFLGLYDRWVDDRHWPTTRDGFFGNLPLAVRWVVATLVRRKVAAGARAQGVARYSDEERAEMARADWRALSATLGDRPFVLGDAPHAVDCALYGFVCQALWAPFETPGTLTVRGDARLVAFGERMRARAWPT